MTRDSPWVSREHGSKVKDETENSGRPGNSSPVGDSKSDESESAPIQASSSSSSSTGSNRCCSDGHRSGPTPTGHGKSSTPGASASTGSSCLDRRHSSTGANRKFSPKERTTGSRSTSQSVRSTVVSSSSPKKESSREPEEVWLDRSVTGSPKANRFSVVDGDQGPGAHKTTDHKTTRHPAASPGTATEPFAHFRQTTGSSSTPATGDCLSPLVLSYLTGMPQYAGHLLPPGSMDPLTTKFPSASLSAYLAYLQSRGGGMAPCKDPFCTECPAVLQPLPLSFPSMTLFDKGPNLRPPYALPLHDRPCPTGPVSLEALSALYAGSLGGSALSPPALPGAWACPWVTTEGEYCGKRCASAEELLVHTRSHWPSSRLSPSPSLHSVAAAGLSGWTGYHPYYPFGPSVSSIALLRHAYGGGGGRNLSPATGLFSLGASGSRYHPYKSPSTSVSLSSPSSSFDLFSNQRTMGAAAP